MRVMNSNRVDPEILSKGLFFAVGFIVLTSCLGASAQPALEFNRDLRPILSDKCFLCHGPDKNMRKAGLRLDVREEALADRKGVRAIVPGDPTASALVARITSHDPNTFMPPAESERTLSEEQKQTLVRWVQEGAEYQPHWSYIVPTRPTPPPADSTWARNPIDRFIVATLTQRGLTPSADADPRTLIRRLSFDLTGLPPTPEDVEAFADDTRPEAYEELVDRLLASPRFGERMAINWLDLVRYADTNGYHGDEYRSVWPYRDYVINAFNSNMPFDRFTIEQLAGDLLPNATRDQKIASGYNRLNQITAEGGAQPKEYIAIYAADRVRTTATAWMGATMGCAQCHDHKFDPYTTKDFYRFSAFFADVQETPVYSAGGKWEPFMPLPTPEQEAELARIDGELAGLRAQFAADTEELRVARQQWETRLRDELADGSNDWLAVKPVALATDHETVLTLQDDASVLASGPDPDFDNYHVELRTDLAAIRGVHLEVLAHPSLPNGLSRSNGNFVLTDFDVAIRGADGASRPVAIANAMASYEQGDYKVAAAIDEDPKTGWAAESYNKDGDRHAIFTFAEAQALQPGDVVLVTIKHESIHAKHTIGRFRLSLTSVASPQLPAAYRVPQEIRDIVQAAPDARTDEQRAKLDAHFRTESPELAEVRTALQQREQERNALVAQIPTTLVTVATEPRVTRVLARGNWMDESGEVVEPATPGFLPPLGVADRRATRLDLAHWLVDEKNPLTARAFVNRTWKLLFGTGISKVLDDLGGQGEWPKHPELLDWLAVEFRESGWDMKHLIKTIVMSSTYRQASEMSEDVYEADPYNRLLARQSRFRLNAEMVRDNALAVSGLLRETLGGPSVFPYQPDGYWDNCNTFTGPLIYTTSSDENQYRRGLYTIWKRSFLHPSILAFDAPTREECTAERTLSNTPLQALVLLNDPTYVEAARAFAEHILTEGGASSVERIQWAFRRALNRPATADEHQLLADLRTKHHGEYTANPAAADALLKAGLAPVPEGIDKIELAAWTNVARVILNLHETITRT